VLLVVGAEFDLRNVVSTFVVAFLPPLLPPGIEMFLSDNDPPNDDSNDTDDVGGNNDC
jgi:hypothetical protein